MCGLQRSSWTTSKLEQKSFGSNPWPQRPSGAPTLVNIATVSVGRLVCWLYRPAKTLQTKGNTFCSMVVILQYCISRDHYIIQTTKYIQRSKVVTLVYGLFDFISNHFKLHSAQVYTPLSLQFGGARQGFDLAILRQISGTDYPDDLTRNVPYIKCNKCNA